MLETIFSIPSFVFLSICQCHERSFLVSSAFRIILWAVYPDAAAAKYNPPELVNRIGISPYDAQNS